MKLSEIADFLNTRVPLFRGFPGGQMERLLEAAQVVVFETNEFILDFGQEAHFLGVVLEGAAEASVADESGDRVSLWKVGPGELFGDIALMTGDRTVANVVATARCTALLIPAAVFAAEIATFPPAIQALSRGIAEKARRLPAVNTAAAAVRARHDPYGLALASETPMRLLTLHAGAGFLRYQLFDTAEAARNASGAIEGLDTNRARATHHDAKGTVTRDLPGGGIRGALDAVLALLTERGAIRSANNISAVGHRVIHGGDRFDASRLVDDDAVLAGIESLDPLAPLDNPVNAACLREARRLFPLAPHVAVFDTVFHRTLPPYASVYGLPYEYQEEKGIRRFGFHGLSHEYAAVRAAEALGRPIHDLEIITIHLGKGASMCAVDHGRSVDTTMGFTPTEGLLMATRSGDVDPGVLVHLLRTEGLNADALEDLLNRKGGIAGLSGLSGDMIEVEKAAQAGHPRALLAFKTFCYRIRKTIGAYAAAMQGLDAVVFTGGIGTGSPGVRSLACQGLSALGIRLDEIRNRATDGAPEAREISDDDAPVRVLVVPSNEGLMVARETLRTLKRQYIGKILEAQKTVPILIEVSAHHVHLTQEHVEALYGQGHQLTFEYELSQPGQFACKEMVTLVGPKGRVERVRVLGPVRKATQVEIAMTEQFKLGIHPPIRESGDLNGTPGVTIEGPAGTITIEQGVICALRHVHMHPEDALRFGLRDKYVVRVRVAGDRELVFGDVVVRVSPDFRLAMHIDTDEANAANIKTGMTGHIDAIQSQN